MRHVFVSSTFRDMQAERDMLHTMVIPELNAMALEYGESVGFIDLRWGVNTGDMDTESGAKKVLSVCLDEIDHCKPYMVIFLGERYGWIPDGQLMSNAASEKNFTLDDMEKSVTALEIEYGALSKEDNLEHCIFCIREPLPYDKMTKQQQADYASESPLHKQRLDSLKMRITKLLNEKVITYKANWDETNEKITGLQPLAQALCKRFSEMFSREWQQYNSYTWQQKEQLAFRTYADEKCSRFAGREHLLSLYKNELLNDDTRIFLLQGQTGSGKSSILSMLAKRLEAEDNNLFLFFCGNSANSCEAEDMLKQIIYYVETQLNIKKHFGEDKAEEKANNDDNETKNITIADLQNEFAVLAQRYGFSEKKPLVMIFDAIDQMNSNEILEQFAWIPQVIPQNIKLVISCLSSYKIPSHFPCGKYLKTQLLESFDVNESEEFIQGILRANSKGLDKEVINELKSKQGADTPLYISVLLQRLLIMDIDDFKEADKLGAGGIGLNKQMINLIHSCPTELNALCAALLFEAAERINTELCTQALLLLSTARYGLRLSDLEAIFISAGYEWNSLDFSRLTKYMYSYFTLRSDGRIDFTHQSIRKGIQAKNHEKEKHYHHLILQQIKALPIADAFRVSEALYHAYQINDIEFAVNFMAVALNISDDASKIAAKELKTICVQDNAKWLIAILKTQAAYKVYDIESFIKFIIGELQDTFKMTTKEREVATLIVNEASIYLINILKTNNTEPFKICYVESLYLLGKYTEDLANHKLALEYYDKYCTACKEWLEELCEAGEDIEDCMQRIIKGVKKIASIFEQNGDYTEAIEYYKIVISMAEDQCKENPRKFNKRLLSKCYNSMATVLLWVNDYNKSAEYRIKSIEISEEIFDEDPSADNLWYYTSSIHRYGRTYLLLGLFSDAFKYYKLALDYCEELVKAEDSYDNRCLLADIYNSLSVCGREVSKYSEALDYSQKAMQIRYELADEYDMPDNYISLILAHTQTADCLIVLGNKSEAYSILQKGLDLCEKVELLSETIMYLEVVARLHFGLANILTGYDKSDEAIKHYKTAQLLAIKQAAISNSKEAYQNVAAVYTKIASLYQKTKQNALALINYKRALKWVAKLKGSSNFFHMSDLATVNYYIADVYYDYEKYDKAQKHYETFFNIVDSFSQDQKEYRIAAITHRLLYGSTRMAYMLIKQQAIEKAVPYLVRIPELQKKENESLETPDFSCENYSINQLLDYYIDNTDIDNVLKYFDRYLELLVLDIDNYFDSLNLTDVYEKNNVVIKIIDLLLENSKNSEAVYYSKEYLNSYRWLENNYESPEIYTGIAFGYFESAHALDYSGEQAKEYIIKSAEILDMLFKETNEEWFNENREVVLSYINEE